jgi:hypothetical protein
MEWLQQHGALVSSGRAVEGRWKGGGRAVVRRSEGRLKAGQRL